MADTCPQCGITFYDAWERSRHAIGKHGYRSWTHEDKKRKAGEIQMRGAKSARQRDA